jgi:pimeloyl-ACP methyl ester carboxylesterase
MRVAVNGTRLWFDVEGAALEPSGSTMRGRPTLLLVHGGPGTYDHSYFKPWFGQLAADLQVVYLDLRGHGRSDWPDATDFSFEQCADDVRAFCDAVGLERPVVLGHSMGGFVAMLCGSRHPGHASGLIVVGTNARFDLERLVEGVRAVTGTAAADVARRSYSGDQVSDEEWAGVFAAFGPHVPTAEVLARRRRNLEVSAVGMDLLRSFDCRHELAAVTCPVLVIAGQRDGVMPISAGQEIVDWLPAGIGELVVLPDAGHFPWLDTPGPFFARISEFASRVTERDRRLGGD